MLIISVTKRVPKKSLPVTLNFKARFETTIRQLSTSIEGTQGQLTEAQEDLESLKSRLRKKNVNVGGNNKIISFKLKNIKSRQYLIMR